jgi:CheY-like chemotaxis protein
MLDSFLALERVVVVEDGPSAMAAIAKGQPDLIILDSHLFAEDTAAVVRAVKQECNGAHCVVVVDKLGQFRPILDAGADRVLLKGFSAADLAAALERPTSPPLADGSG